MGCVSTKQKATAQIEPVVATADSVGNLRWGGISMHEVEAEVNERNKIATSIKRHSQGMKKLIKVSYPLGKTLTRLILAICFVYFFAKIQAIFRGNSSRRLLFMQKSSAFLGKANSIKQPRVSHQMYLDGEDK